ncbi:MAG: carbamoyl phosphate synthase large subunit [Armatimonadetes bacterium JP3_11]|nr:MAG: carbamoyl phosphate synthase large subunit [Armatimonadetes bacterium JP3_11]RMH07535.1 MAG: carbamoyl-phosphate synthase large subunit [Armatimonadota bacterium]
MPIDTSIRKVLVIGSGPIVIGQAAEFDYSGSQACRSLREEGLEVVLINSNPATIMTDPETADRVYIEPLTVEFAERVIAQERPDGLLPTLGGQTGLNLATELAVRGILDKYHVRLLGTPLTAIQAAEDREKFRDLMRQIGEPVPESWIVESVSELRRVAEIAPYPCIVRPAYTLGGTGGGIARSPDELLEIGARGLELSMRHQVMVERSLLGWKEIEYEVMRDGADNAIVVCNMENLDPMGVHTGDSMVVAPSQTLSDFEYQLLRTASLRIIRALGIQGGCNVQLALNPNGSDYYVIEVNPRVSRSSALASKATGYPIARIAAKIAVGLRLDEIRNPITGTSAAFEPALDYCVVKLPRFPFDKFPTGDRTLGTQMKATGEVMAIDRTFEGALMKAVRGLEVGVSDLRYPPAARLSPMELETLLETPNDMRLFYIAEAFRRGWLVEEVHALCKIDPWFLHKIKHLVEMEQELIARSGELRELLLDAQSSQTHSLLRRAKEWQFSDKFLSQITGLSEAQVRAGRTALGITPAFKMVDTCAGEFEAQTPYFYSTYHGVSDRPAPQHPKKALVLGSGPIRIGQGIEFDYSAVHAVKTLRRLGYYAMILNNNPETVSTDFDISDALYFDPVTTEDVLNVLEYESGAPAQDESVTIPVLVQFGGQTAINLVKSLQAFGIPLLGTPADSIDIAEDRRRFDALLEDLKIPRPPGRAVLTLEDALQTAHAVGYPVLVRPSYVLGGRAMEIVRTDHELETYWRSAVLAFPDAPVLVDKYIQGKEAEVDLIGDGEQFIIPAIMEHIERAGVHSGDSMTVVPPQTLTESEQAQIRDYALRLAKALRVCGLVNMQFVVQDGAVYVIEVNPRASRTVPYLSKITHVPMVSLAVAAQVGIPLPCHTPNREHPIDRIAVKAPVFSSLKLKQVEVALGPEMRSTGEVMGIDRTYAAALYKAMVAAGIRIPRQGSILLTLADKDKAEGVALAHAFHKKGFQLCATQGTARALQEAGLPVQVVPKIGQGKPDLLDHITGKRVQLLVNTPSPDRRAEQQGLLIRRAAVETGIPCLTALDTAWALLQALEAGEFEVAPIGASCLPSLSAEHIVETRAT